jgi:hypothetical protein
MITRAVVGFKYSIYCPEGVMKNAKILESAYCSGWNKQFPACNCYFMQLYQMRKYLPVGA